MSAFHATMNFDRLRIPQAFTNSTGTIAWKATYSAFGNATVDPASSITSNLRFPGQYYDAETNLHYNWNRYYDPKTGRYLTPDPIGLDGGINLFVYVEGNPVNLYDVFGLFPDVPSMPGYNPYVPPPEYRNPPAPKCTIKIHYAPVDSASTPTIATAARAGRGGTQGPGGSAGGLGFTPRGARQGSGGMVGGCYMKPIKCIEECYDSWCGTKTVKVVDCLLSQDTREFAPGMMIQNGIVCFQPLFTGDRK